MTRSLALLLCLALAAGAQTTLSSSCAPTSVPALVDGRMFMCIDPQSNWHMRRPRLADLMPIVEPLPPPKLIEIVSYVLGYDPKRMDVPAIQEEQDVLTGTDTCKAAPECAGKDWSCNLMVCSHDTAKLTKTTCADKSRVLLTDESGARHCIQFGGAQ